MTETAAENIPSRPVLRWHGGKWRLAKWIIEHFPTHRTYVEPYGGAASVLIRKPRAYAEIYNDLDDEVVNLFRVLRDRDQARALIENIRMTPFARSEFVEAREATTDPVERARQCVILSYMGFGSAGVLGFTTGFRASSSRSGTTPAHDWARYPAALQAIVERLIGVVIESRPALQVMAAHDRSETLHYVDPPYLPETRSAKRGPSGMYHSYRHEMTEADHLELLSFLDQLKGYVVVSGYPSEIYDTALAGWIRREREARADGGRKRVECLWLNPAAASACSNLQMPLLPSARPADPKVTT